MIKEWMLYVEYLASIPRIAKGEITEAEQCHISGLLLKETKSFTIWQDILGKEIKDAIENWLITGTDEDAHMLLDEIKSSVIRKFDPQVQLLLGNALKEQQKDAATLDADE